MLPAGSMRREVWGDPGVRGEGESWVRAGNSSLGMLPLDLGDLGDLGWDFFFFKVKRTLFKHRFTNHKVKEGGWKEPTSWRTEQHL